MAHGAPPSPACHIVHSPSFTWSPPPLLCHVQCLPTVCPTELFPSLTLCHHGPLSCVTLTPCPSDVSRGGPAVLRYHTSHSSHPCVTPSPAPLCHTELLSHGHITRRRSCTHGLSHRAPPHVSHRGPFCPVSPGALSYHT